MEVNGQYNALAALALGRDTSTYLIGCWVGPRTGVDTELRKIQNNQKYTFV
jgi:hypothetical protein